MKHDITHATKHADPIAFIGPGGTKAPLTPHDFGSKAAQLWRMNALGLDVPPAFVLSTSLCGERRADEVRRLLEDGLAFLEAATGRRFGDRRRPLLVSVRSGAEKSMPGMLETVLDVGMTAETARGLMRLHGNPRLAFDCHRRFIEGWCEVVAGLPRAPFEQVQRDLIAAEQAGSEQGLDPEALERLAARYLDLARDSYGASVPADPRDQLSEAVEAVFRSWAAPKAMEYRRLNHLEHLAGTAVTVQAMVFGNAGVRSGSGVAFSRNPASGAPGLYADLLFDAQGEDVVSGRRQPVGLDRLGAVLPDVASALAQGVAALERHYRDVQDVEFTFEEGRLYFLQTRAAKRTPRAALKIAVDMVAEGAITPAEGLALLEGVDLGAVAATRFSGDAEPVAHGVAASPGTVSGRVAFDEAGARRLAAAGDPVVLLRPDVATDDIAALALASGILTSVGGRTAHAAVVARQLGRACVVGCSALVIDDAARRARLGAETLAEGDWLSLDGEAGSVFLGRRTVVSEEPEAELAAVAGWRAAAPSPA